jgi:hypothetical protein
VLWIRYGSLDQFDVGDYLGGGTFGKVFKAFHIESQEVCVIKEIDLHGAEDKHVKQCMEEAKFLMRNRHPHIIGKSIILFSFRILS